MSIIDNFLNNMVEKPDYPYSVTFLFFMVSFIGLMLIGNLIVIYMARKTIHKLDSSNKAMRNFYYAIIALAINPLGGLISFLYRLSVQNASAILIGNANFHFVISGSLFTIFFTTYVTNSVNLSKTGQRIFKLLTRTLFIVSPIALLIMFYNKINPISKSILTVTLVILATIFFLDIFITLVFLIIDYRRISNKLLKTRLGMSILAGVGFFIEGICAIGYLLSVLLQGQYIQVIPLYATGLYTTTFLMSLFLYWGFFIPIKIQEWAGILPPSYKLLKQKQKTLQTKVKIQG